MISHRRKAMMLVYCAVSITALMAMVSLSVDWGRMQAAKQELQIAADAAARYAVTGLADGTTLTKAQQAAAQNSVDGSTMALTSADVTVGTWNATARSFTPGGTNANAVQVVARRTASRGNAVPLVFAQAIGKSTCDVSATAVACQPTLPYSMVALNSLRMLPSSTIQRKAGETGKTIVASNDTSWQMNGSAKIYGDALYRGSAPSGNITGTSTAMSSDISYTVVSTPYIAPGNSFPSGVTVSSGSYGPYNGDWSTSSLQLSGTASISMNGDLNLYCSGPCSFSNNANIITNGHKLTVYMTNSSTIAFTNALPLQVVIYGPSCTMSVNASGKITGSFVCSSLDMQGGTIEYTSALPIPIAPSGGGSAAASGVISTVAVAPVPGP